MTLYCVLASCSDHLQCGRTGRLSIHLSGVICRLGIIQASHLPQLVISSSLLYTVQVFLFCSLCYLPFYIQPLEVAFNRDLIIHIHPVTVYDYYY